MSFRTQLRPRHQQLFAHAGVAALVTDLTGQVRGSRDGYFLEEMRLLARAAVEVDGRAPEVFSAGLAGPTVIVAHGQAAVTATCWKTRSSWRFAGSWRLTVRSAASTSLTM